MAQTNYTPISLYYSTTASAVPTAANLVQGELAINTNDGKLYYEDSSGVVQVLATKSTGSIGGSTTQVQYNLSGSLAGSANMTFNGTTLTVNDLTDSSLTTGRVVYSTTGGNLTSSANLLYSGTDLTVYGLTVGRGGSAVSTNTALGVSALSANTSGSYNSAIGYQSSQSIQGGGGNVSFGGLALRLNVSGDSNSAFGVNALENNTATANTAIGRQALQANTTASYNTALGWQAGYTNTTGIGITAIGAGALRLNTTGSSNTAIGSTDGVSIGAALSSNTTGSYNVAIGTGALLSNTTASNNTAVGYQAGYNLITSGENTAVGYQALYTNTASGDNVAIGRNALKLSTGAGNTVIGEGGGSAITTGAKNTILGRYTGNQGGLDIRTASNYIVLSDGDGNPRMYMDSFGACTFTGATFSGLLGTASTYGYWSNSNSTSYIQFNGASAGVPNTVYVTAASGGVQLNPAATAWSSASDVRLKNVTGKYDNALADIAQIEPVKFTWKSDTENKPQVGVLAHTVKTVVPEAVDSQTLVRSEDTTEYLSVRYTELIPLMIASIQELKAEFDAYKATHP